LDIRLGKEPNCQPAKAGDGLAQNFDALSGKVSGHTMGLILLLVVLVLLSGGGGFYLGAPYHYFGGGLGTILVIVIIVLLPRG
jgi:hypothetical protein